MVSGACVRLLVAGTMALSEVYSPRDEHLICSKLCSDHTVTSASIAERTRGVFPIPALAAVAMDDCNQPGQFLFCRLPYYHLVQSGAASHAHYSAEEVAFRVSCPRGQFSHRAVEL